MLCLTQQSDLSVLSFFRSPGFGLSLVAESTTGVVLAVEAMSAEKTDSNELTLPEDLGQQTAKMFLKLIDVINSFTSNVAADMSNECHKLTLCQI